MWRSFLHCWPERYWPSARRVEPQLKLSTRLNRPRDFPNEWIPIWVHREVRQDFPDLFRCASDRNFSFNLLQSRLQVAERTKNYGVGPA